MGAPRPIDKGAGKSRPITSADVAVKAFRAIASYAPVAPMVKGYVKGYTPSMSSQLPQGGTVPVVDWTCLECGNLNYASRVECNSKRCTAVRPGMKTGDWICKLCRNHNYASREVCNSSKCGAPRDPPLDIAVGIE